MSQTGQLIDCRLPINVMHTGLRADTWPTAIFIPTSDRYRSMGGPCARTTQLTLRRRDAGRTTHYAMKVMWQVWKIIHRRVASLTLLPMSGLLTEVVTEATK